MKKIIFIFAPLILVGAGAVYYFSQQRPPVETKFIQPPAQRTLRPGGEEGAGGQYAGVNIKEPGDSALLSNPNHTYQTFNNCGPATLSMALSWYGQNISQKELGDKMRPYQNPKGDNDDKTIFTYEFVKWAKAYGFESISRVNGDIELLKTFTTNGIPVVVKTWLNVDDDIGHFRIVRGFDEEREVIIQDDSYHGPNKKISYYDFLSMWQPFNYNYMIVYTSDKEDLVKAIIGEEIDEKVAWQNALSRAEKEAKLTPENVYPYFNLSTSYYHLNDFQNSTLAFEQVEARLPGRMLWYQIEPIEAYVELEEYTRAFQIMDQILENGNRAYSELYQLKGEVYLAQGDIDKAREQFELALIYNENFEPARESLRLLHD